MIRLLPGILEDLLYSLVQLLSFYELLLHNKGHAVYEQTMYHLMYSLAVTSVLNEAGLLQIPAKSQHLPKDSC